MEADHRFANLACQYGKAPWSPRIIALRFGTCADFGSPILKAEERHVALTLGISRDAKRRQSACRCWTATPTSSSHFISAAGIVPLMSRTSNSSQRVPRMSALYAIYTHVHQGFRTLHDVNKAIASKNLSRVS